MTSDVEAAVDRISILPRNLIDLILKRLPIHEAARTSVLSNTWRNIWGTQSHLVFDDNFFSKLVPRDDNIQAQLHKATKTIYSILLLHSGPILKFHLFIPEDLPLNQDLDMWIKHVSTNGVRRLKLFNDLPVAYKLPSNLFSCFGLTDLWLKNCILHPPHRFRGFRNLKSVELLDVTIDADISFGLQLQELDLERCKGIEHLRCQFNYNNNLTVLMIDECGPLDWQWFEFTHKVKEFALMNVYEEGYINEKKAINFDKFVDNMPEISILSLDGYILQVLEPGAANSWKLTTAMENLEELYLYEIEFPNLLQMQYVLCLIQSSPNLRYLSIGMVNCCGGVMAVSAVEQYLQLPNFNGMVFDQLKTVEIEGIVGSRAELHLIKILLASTPSLRWMKLKYNAEHVDSQKELIILRELLHFSRASTSAHIISD